MPLNERWRVRCVLAIALVALVSLASFSNAHAYGYSENVRQNPYPYCNVYLTDLCFGIASGDVLTMKIPVDVVFYEVKLSNGANVTVFDGYLPANPFGGKDKKLAKLNTGIDANTVHRQVATIYFIKQSINQRSLLYMCVISMLEIKSP